MTIDKKPQSPPPGMTFRKMLAMPVIKSKWRESGRYLCTHCMQFAFHHPYTNDIWGCRHCETTTTRLRANFFMLDGDEQLPVGTRPGARTPFEPDNLLTLPEKDQLPEFAVALQRMPKGTFAVDPNDRNNQGRRTKLGGLPDWIQGHETPKCVGCKTRMTFVAQVNSIEHFSLSNPIGMDVKHRDRRKKSWMFGDVGMIYVFYCFGCGEAKAVGQQY